MCSISGIVSLNQDHIDNLQQRISSMNDILKHRGPDNSHIFVNNILAFGHNRLAIIDLDDRSNQPLFDYYKKYIIIFNGEIYNYKELREKLKKKYIFKSNSDTETLLIGYIEYGEKILDLLEGFYSFCIYNIEEKSFFLARDNSGVKPLYYCIEENIFYFSSEIKSLLKVINKKTLSQKNLGMYFTLGYIPSPLTPFNEIFQLKPASTITIKNNQIKFKDNELLKQVESQKSNLYSIINKSVKTATTSDVTLGLLLSSGLDSNILLHHLLENNLKFSAISVGFKNDNSYDETKIVKKIIDINNLDGKIIYIDDYNIEKLFNHTVYHLDNLNCNPANMALNVLFKESSKSHKVFLAGSGMDEFFGGYMTYKASMINDWLKKIPGSSYISKSSYILDKLNFSTESKYDSYYLISKFITNSALSDISSHLYWRSIWGPYEAEKLVHNYNSKNLDNIILNELSRYFTNDINNNRMLIDYRYFLIDNQMLMTDNLSMAHSVEIRPTFLQKNLINQSFSIPSNQKFNLFNNKKVLRNIYAKKLKPDLTKSKKTGLVMPLSKILNNQLKKNVYDILENKKIFDHLDFVEVESTIKKFYKDNNYSLVYKIYSLLTFSEWFKKFI